MAEKEKETETETKTESDLILEMKKSYDAKLHDLEAKIADKDKTIKDLLVYGKEKQEADAEADEDTQEITLDDYVAKASANVAKRVQRKIKRN